MNAQTRATTDLMVLMMAMLSGIGIAVLAVMAAGHEWPALRYAASAIVTVPIGGLAFCYRERPTMVYLARMLTVLHILIDVFFAVMTYRVADRIEGVPPAALIALMLWALWQGLTAAAALGTSVRRSVSASAR
jgi:hypothetical protein